jgi:regulator of protease activity HflC (stomatin/prohibitin superfamily)
MFRKLAIAAALALSLSACSYEKVPAGHVGVKVYLLGTDKGVDHESVGVGRYFLTMNEDLYLFPTFTQNHTWAKAGPNGDESLTFQTVEGLPVSGDFGISYSIDPAKVSAVFQKYRKGVDEITSIYLRNMVRDALVKRGSSLPVESVYGKGKTELIEMVQRDVVEQVKDIGIVVEKIYLVGELRLPQVVVNAVNAKIAATQMAQQRENEVAQAKAEADKVIAQARGEAEARLVNSKAEAESLNIKGAALRANPEIVQLSAVEKWDGVLPVVAGSNGTVPFVDLKALSKDK